MLSREFDIAIIGGGCIGSSILHELSYRGIRNCVLVDSGRNTKSATIHSGGMLRVFHESASHLSLAIENHNLLNTYLKLKVLTENSVNNGNLYFFNKDRYKNYIENLLSMSQSDYPFELYTAETGKAKFPQFNWKGDWAIYEPKAKQLSPELFMLNLHEASKKYEASIMDDVEIKHIRLVKNYYELTGDKQSCYAKSVILAGGVRMHSILNALGLNLSLQAKSIESFVAPKILHDSLMPNYFDRESLEYGSFGHADQVILSHEASPRVHDKQWSEIAFSRHAKDSYAPGRHGYLGKIPGYNNLFIATGWGGTAFKFSLAIAYRVANAIEANY